MNDHTRSVPTDVVVVGAGAAGLAAARRLHQLSVDMLVLEARERIGGRAFTLRTHDGAFPIELGAEFIHGTARSTMDLLRESGEGTVHMGDSPGDVWDAAMRVLQRVDLHGPDTSVDAFLNAVGTRDAQLARMLIEGFDAAIATDASIVAIAREWRSHVNDTQFRPANGYGVMLHFLANVVNDRVWLNSPVHEIHWSRGGVEIRAVRDGEQATVQARHAIVTLPIGVLRAGAVRFVPELPAEKRAAIEAVGMGPVVKVVLEFRSIFWKDAFVMTPPGSPFPTVWSRDPQPAPVLVAWAGGDAANRLIERHADPVAAALDVCAQLFPAVDVRGQLVAAHCHDWQDDSYARGAYSYLRVNADGARHGLAQPIEDTLFFAGEATSEDDSGTVAGALDSGYRAAAQVLARSGR